MGGQIELTQAVVVQYSFILSSSQKKGTSKLKVMVGGGKLLAREVVNFLHTSTVHGLQYLAPGHTAATKLIWVSFRAFCTKTLNDGNVSFRAPWWRAASR